MEDRDTIRLRSGALVRVVDELPRPGTAVAAGVRPEKLRFDEDGANRLSGTVKELSYVGVATQYVVETPDGLLAVYVQNTEPGFRSVEAGTTVHVAFAPESTFVVDLTEEEEPA